jgi:cysteine-rich repeat protein
MMNISRNGALAIGAALLLVAGSAGAQPTKDSLKCSSSKLKAYGKDLGAKLKCYSKAVGKGDPVDPECLSKAEANTTKSFDKAESKGGCPTDGNPDGDLPNSLDRLNEFVGEITAALAPNPGPNKCQSKKLGAASKLAAALFNCESKAAKKNVEVDQVKCVDKAVQKTLDGFAKEEAKAKVPCDTTGDADATAGATEDVVHFQTGVTPRFDGCGNQIVRAPETCDDGNTENFDFCPNSCIVLFCDPNSASTRTVTVVTSTPDLAAVTIDLDYPEDKVSLPGIGGNVPDGVVMGPDPLTPAQPNDFEHAVRLVIFSPFNFDTTDVATLAFNDCNGATAPTPGDFSCTVVDAGAEDGMGGFVPVQGVTCSVTVAP